MTLTTDQQPNRLNPFSKAENNFIPPPFYVVSEKKFWLLFMMTFSLYLLYWFYKQWRTWKVVTGEKVMPIARTIFWVFMVWGLIRRIFDRAKLVDNNLKFRTLEKATGIAVLAMFASRINDKMTGDDTSLLWFGITLICLIVTARGMTTIQCFVNIACHDPQGISNSKLTVANYVWLIFGGIFWLLVLIGTFTTP